MALEVNRLNQEELAYEMEARGLEVTTVDEMRKRFRATLRLERRGSVDTLQNYPFEFAEDKEALEAKMKEIEDLTSTLPPNQKGSEFFKVLAKVEWGLRRIGNSRPGDKEEVSLQAKIRTKLLDQLMRINEIVGDEDLEDEDPVAPTPPPKDKTLLSQPTEELRQEIIDTVRSMQEPPRFLDPVVQFDRTACWARPENLSKWDLKFSGEKGTMSLHAFLERVEELRYTRSVSPSDLFRGAADLFSGKALIWFRANRANCISWQDVVEELKLEFLSPNYDDQLLDEIRRRTQGAQESVGCYVAVMRNLFGRLSEPLSEERMLRIVKANLTPFFQTQLGLASPESLRELVALGRKLEAVRQNVEDFVPPPAPRSRGLLEPDLAYVHEVATPESRSDSRPQRWERQIRAPPLNRAAMRCFACKEVGHVSRDCPNIKCFGCGKIGVRRTDCPRCNDARGPTFSGGNQLAAIAPPPTPLPRRSPVEQTPPQPAPRGHRREGHEMRPNTDQRSWSNNGGLPNNGHGPNNGRNSRPNNGDRPNGVIRRNPFRDNVSGNGRRAPN